MIQPLDDLIALDESVHSVHVDRELSNGLEDVLLIGLVTVSTDGYQSIETLVADKLKNKIFIILRRMRVQKW